MMWQIGGGKGVNFELNGHTGKVTGLAYLADRKKLISVCTCFHCVFIGMTVLPGGPGQHIYCVGPYIGSR